MIEESNADFDYCRQITKKNSTNFYRAFSTMPREQANAVFAIYTFCRQIDDIADSAVLSLAEKSEQLTFWESVLADRSAHFDIKGVPSLDATIRDFQIDVALLREQITGQRMDLAFRQPQDMEELLKYCYFVAGNLGLILLPIISEQREADWQQSCIELGIAMQITNILRDIGEDFEQHQRIYLPQTLLDKYAYTHHELASQTINANFIALWEELAKEAEQRYAAFEREKQRLSASAKKSVLFAARSYREILAGVRDNQYDCFTKRAYVTKTKAVSIYRQLEKELKKTS